MVRLTELLEQNEYVGGGQGGHRLGGWESVLLNKYLCAPNYVCLLLILNMFICEGRALEVD